MLAAHFSVRFLSDSLHSAPSEYQIRRPGYDDCRYGKTAGGSDGALFYIARINDVEKNENLLVQLKRESFGQGDKLVGRTFQHYAQPGGGSLGVTGYYTYAAPIDILLRKAGSYKVAAEVNVDLQADPTFFVRAHLDPCRREIWLEDASGKRLSPVIVYNGSAKDYAMEMTQAAYSCCNLRYECDYQRHQHHDTSLYSGWGQNLSGRLRLKSCPRQYRRPPNAGRHRLRPQRANPGQVDHSPWPKGTYRWL